MAFWSDKEISEPLRQNRWYIEFDNLVDYKFALKSCSKPEYDIGVSEHVLLNHTFRYPKNLVWKPISVKMIAVTVNSDEYFFDNANPYTQGKTSLAEKLYQMLYYSGYKPPHEEQDTSEIFDKTNMSKHLLSNSLLLSQNKRLDNDTAKQAAAGGKLRLIQIDSNGNGIEFWELYNPFINNIKFGSLNYESDGFVDIDLNITYDYAKVYVQPSYDKGLERQTFTIFGLDTGINNPFASGPTPQDISPGFPNK